MAALPYHFEKTFIGSHRFLKWFGTLALGAISVTCCYFWIDRPLAMWFYAYQNHFVTRDDLNLIAGIPDPAALVSLVLFFLFGFSQVDKRAFKHWKRVALASSISILVGEAIKDILKWLFGRPSPYIWAMSNSSAMGSQNYQFHWLHGIEPFNSFPSGHMTAATAAVAILWTQYPQFRPIYAACCLALAAGLVAFNFHFLGDVIAGATLGTLVGLIVSYSLPGRNAAGLDSTNSSEPGPATAWRPHSRRCGVERQ